jgi:hypothetical protein
MTGSRLDRYAGSGHKSHSLHFAQRLWIAVGNTADDARDAARPLRKRDLTALRDCAVFLGMLWPWGSVSGSPNLAAIRFSSRSEM